MVEDPEIAWTNAFGLLAIPSAQASRRQKARLRSVYRRVSALKDNTDCIALSRTKVAVPDSRVQRAYRVRISLFLLAVSLVLVVWVVGYQAIQTLKVLDVVERERDRWQQAGPVIEALNLKDGSIVADIGSGAGYFTLKLAPIVGDKGRVIAEDILKRAISVSMDQSLLAPSA